MKILLTGASGMVGRNFVDIASNELTMLTPSSVELNLLNFSSVKSYLDQNRPDAVIHAAGRVGGIHANMAQPVKFLSENMTMGFNIVNAAREAGIKNFLNLSSSCIYPKLASNPLQESDILSGYLEPTNEGYALAKISVMRLCSYISSATELNYKTLIPCNLYGKHDKFSPESSHMIPGVIRRIHEAKISGKESLEIWGDGLARREFMYAEDLAQFMQKILLSDALKSLPNELNVGLERDYEINEYYEVIADIVGYKGTFSHDLTKPVGMKQKLMDSSLAAGAFGWSARTSLEAGVKQTYQHFLELHA